MKTKTFFTSDTHFRHANIIKYCNRPFSSVKEMDEEMIRRWNEVVGPEDEVFHLGDFSVWYGGVEPADYFDRLNGRKHLISGNHDPRHIVITCEWESIRDYREFRIGNDNLVLSHYPMRSWNGSFRGSIMLYGHVHNTLPVIKNSLDVGVDAWDYRPVTLEQIKERLSTVES